MIAGLTPSDCPAWTIRSLMLCSRSSIRPAMSSIRVMIWKEVEGNFIKAPYVSSLQLERPDPGTRPPPWYDIRQFSLLGRSQYDNLYWAFHQISPNIWPINEILILVDARNSVWVTWRLLRAIRNNKLCFWKISLLILDQPTSSMWHWFNFLKEAPIIKTCGIQSQQSFTWSDIDWNLSCICCSMFWM